MGFHQLVHVDKDSADVTSAGRSFQSGPTTERVPTDYRRRRGIKCGYAQCKAQKAESGEGFLERGNKPPPHMQLAGRAILVLELILVFVFILF